MKNLLKTSLIASLLWMAPLEQGLAQTSDNSIFFDDFDSSPSGTRGIVEDPEEGDRAFSWKDFKNNSGSPDTRRITIPKGKHHFKADLLAKPGGVTPLLRQYLQRKHGFDIVTGKWQTVAFDLKIHQEVSFTVGEFLRDSLGFTSRFGGVSDLLFDNVSLQNLAATDPAVPADPANPADAADPGGAQFQPTTEPLPQSVSFIRIGDFDGFGFGKGEGLTAANGGPVNKDGQGSLASGDLLPDLNRDGRVAVDSKDNFDNRSEEERSLSNDSVTSNGFIDVASVGSLLTDVALSTSQPKKENIPTAHKANFVFDFSVDRDKINPNNPIFFNLLFGDYDVGKAKIQITGVNGHTTTRILTVQDNKSGENGLIQSAFSQLEFDDVFIANDTGYDGYLEVEFKAKNEPYVAFDFVELSTAKIGTSAESVPEPSTILGGLAFGAFITKLRQKRKQQNLAK
ncbi:MAG: hypothetical protein F6J93_31835 [Oscillatoria sp. SIO1A7]|nr:hypothetical protein [Oscillatoria sp. SIO1A7]